MILTCPSCGTQYVVKDGAIPPGGRQVRCAACKHSWHEDPEGAADTLAEPETRSAVDSQAVEEALEAPAPEEETVAEATLIEPRSGPEAEERAWEEAALGEAEEASSNEVAQETEDLSGAYPRAQFDIAKKDSDGSAVASDWSEPPQPEAAGDEFTPYPPTDEEQPRRRGALLPILIVIAVVVIVAAALWFLAPPDMKARLGLASVGTSPLALVTTHMDRQRLESGNELLTVAGRVINPTTNEQNVPPLRAQLKTRAGKIVYSWTIPPPAHSLQPGASASFNSAEVNVPPGGDELTITLETGTA